MDSSIVATILLSETDNNLTGQVNWVFSSLLSLIIDVDVDMDKQRYYRMYIQSTLQIVINYSWFPTVIQLNWCM